MSAPAHNLAAYGLAAGVVLVFLLAGAWLVEPSGPSPTQEDGGTRLRVVSMAPSITDVLFAIGAGEQVVGVSDYCDYPGEEQALPRLGGQVDPDIEALVALRPQVTFTLGRLPRLAQQAESLGLRTVEVPMDTYSQVLEGIGTIGEVMGRGDEASELKRSIESRLRGLAPVELPPSERPRVLLVVGRQAGALEGIFAAGSRSYLGALLEFAGGRNALDDDILWPQVSLERVVHLDPDIIIELVPEALADDAEAAYLAPWREGLGSLRAVRGEGLHVLSGGGDLIPGPRMTAVAERLAGLVKEHAGQHSE